MPWALTVFGPDGALIVTYVLPLTRMNPGVSPAALVYWPTIWPPSLMPKAVAADPPVGMKVFTLPRERKKALPLPSVPTTVPDELVPKAMAVVDPLMFRSWSLRDRRGLTVKLLIVGRVEVLLTVSVLPDGGAFVRDAGLVPRCPYWGVYPQMVHQN